MKGIVVEINEKTAVVMTDDGIFSKIRNQNYEIGQTITVKKWITAGSRFAAGAAGLAAAIVLCTIGSYAYYTPTDYVSMDINPSIAYTVNRFDRILDTKALNDDGKEILSELNLNNKKIDDALKETLDRLATSGYLGEDQGGDIVITTSNERRIEAEEMAAELEEEVRAYLKHHGEIKGDVKSEVVETRRVEEAKKLGVSPGKLNLVDELQSSTSGAINRSEWLFMPVKEINQEIKKNRKALKEREGFSENPDESGLRNNPNENNDDNKHKGNNLKETWVNEEQDNGEKDEGRFESDENSGNEHRDGEGIDNKKANKKANDKDKAGSKRNSRNNNSSKGKNNGNGVD